MATPCGAPAATLETTEPEFWPLAGLPELSVGRVTAAQLHRLGELAGDPTAGAAFD